MTATNLRVWLLTLGALDIAFGVIYAFTPAGFSWGLVLVGILLSLPWLVCDARRRSTTRSAETVVPPWHPEYEPR